MLLGLQDVPAEPSRSETLDTAREEKAAHLESPTRTPLEGALHQIKERRFIERFYAGFHGFHPYDFFQHSFSRPGDRSKGPAANANTLGEVPDSSWFQSRHGMRAMSVAALAQGPNTGSGPCTDGPWVVVDAKTEGVTPGFRIRDARGDVYFIKFDPLDYPELSTAAEVILVGTWFSFSSRHYAWLNILLVCLWLILIVEIYREHKRMERNTSP